MTGILKVDQWKDSGDNALISSDGSGALTIDSSANNKLTVTGGSLNVEDGYAYGYGDNSYRIEGKDDGANARIAFITGNSEIARFTTSGLAIGGTGAANTLDDYEEGTYSGEVRDSNGVVPSQTAVGHYVKIGNNVTVHGQITLTGATSGTGITYITLPFTVKSNARGGMGIGLVTGGIVSMSSNNKTLNLIPEVNTTPMYFVETDYTGTHTHLTFNSNFGSSGIFSYSGSYITN